MSIALVTGAGGLVGSEAVEFLSRQGLDVVGIENDMRASYFGAEASVAWRIGELERSRPGFRCLSLDIRDREGVDRLVQDLGQDLSLVIHAAAQPSHDWAASDPATDFAVNAGGTQNLLEAVRHHAPGAAFVYLSTNKLYGDTPNRLPLVERETRWEVAEAHPFAAHGIDESMSIDQTTHSLFGVSKLAADLMVQEYGRYFGMNTVCLRCGCLTGGAHAGAEQHGFLSYLMRCTVAGKPYVVHGYKGKQVRDNLHVGDLMQAIWAYAEKPAPAKVYNMGGGRGASCSMLEAIALSERIAGRNLDWRYSDENRVGDHIWWISDTRRFRADYPTFAVTRDVEWTLNEIRDTAGRRWSSEGR